MANVRKIMKPKAGYDYLATAAHFAPGPPAAPQPGTHRELPGMAEAWSDRKLLSPTR